MLKNQAKHFPAFFRFGKKQHRRGQRQDQFGAQLEQSLAMFGRNKKRERKSKHVGNVLLSSHVTIGRGKLDTIVLYM